MSSPPLSLGSLTPWSTWGDYNTYYFAILEALKKVQTATLVRVESCTNDGGVSPFGFVNVTPLVNQVDGNGNPTPHGTVCGLPYLRLQGGANAVIIDPEPGDIGIAVFASRDISKVKSTQDQANPGSGRLFNYADGIYLGGVLNAAPTQYIQFNSDGVSIVSTENIILTGDSIQAGGSPVPVCSQPLVTWINTVLRPALATAGITVPAPPPDALTTTFEAS
jgi:hypothetical protein